MFSKIKNPGAVLKNITTWIFYVELAFSVIGGIILFFEEIRQYNGFLHFWILMYRTLGGRWRDS